VAGKETDALQFIFTENDFYCDSGKWLSDADQALRKRFESDRWAALYHWGITERPKGLSASAAFLYLLSDTFFKALTSLPDLELSRENAKVPLTETDWLLRAVPFAIGAEYINEKWIKRAFQRLNAVFSGEVAAYEGTVALYCIWRSRTNPCVSRNGSFFTWWKTRTGNSRLLF